MILGNNLFCFLKYLVFILLFAIGILKLFIIFFLFVILNTYKILKSK